MLCLVSECGSSSRLVGTFLSVCAFTLLCGLVVVALSRLLLQKKISTPAGTAEDGVFHCTGKVSSKMSSIRPRSSGDTLILFIFLFETSSVKLKWSFRGTAVFCIFSQLPAHNQQCPEM